MGDSSLGTFLVIDDDEGLRTLLNLILSSVGINSICVGTSNEAISALEEDNGTINGILLDLNLENSRGEDLLDQILTFNSDLVVFMISGCLSEEIKERIGDRAINGIITKPFQTAELIQLIRDAVIKRQELITSREGA
ncbi:response regulator [Candidatus Pelagisphaera phototrophica]|uniref:response regulator n=1 Tax=Candidatus Pelagisphaera phototrophica TaxID=2684113 RepID=UPI0019FE1CC4|nr:response regulator [Candidatus Pelagisphaera phototrophica]QXD32691.1 response regulator [Candidatus Pelagisphaera phototrophica]|tara:strand:+ start:345 stop:758 length:414 start_codon:yes stop_codon:yes gene_type:complete